MCISLSHFFLFNLKYLWYLHNEIFSYFLSLRFFFICCYFLINFIYRIVAPKRERLQIALESLKQKEIALEEAMQQLQNLHEQLERLQRTYDAKMKEKENLIKLASISVFLYNAGNDLKWPKSHKAKKGRIDKESQLIMRVHSIKTLLNLFLLFYINTCTNLHLLNFHGQDVFLKEVHP